MTLDQFFEKLRSHVQAGAKFTVSGDRILDDQGRNPIQSVFGMTPQCPSVLRAVQIHGMDPSDASYIRSASQFVFDETHLDPDRLAVVRGKLRGICFPTF